MKSTRIDNHLMCMMNLQTCDVIEQQKEFLTWSTSFLDIVKLANSIVSLIICKAASFNSAAGTEATTATIVAVYATSVASPFVAATAAAVETTASTTGCAVCR